MANRTLINGAKYRDAPARIIERALARREIIPGGCWLYPDVRATDGYGEIGYLAPGRKTVRPSRLGDGSTRHGPHPGQRRARPAGDGMGGDLEDR
jgi:hypothetical protein